MPITHLRPAATPDGSRPPTARPRFNTPHSGYPSPAQDYEEAALNLNEHLIAAPISTFIVRVHGDAMASAGICDGDELLVDKALTPHDGSVVIAVIDGEFVVRRLTASDSSVMLHAENPYQPDVVVTSPECLDIWGVATTCLHHLSPTKAKR